MPDWKTRGLRIIRSGELDGNTPQTPGMTRAEAISRARVGAQKLWAGTVVVHPNAKTGPIITENSKPSSTWYAAAPAFAGEIIWSLSMKPAREISSTFLPTFLIRN